jgi:hypothetical protein
MEEKARKKFVIVRTVKQTYEVDAAEGEWPGGYNWEWIQKHIKEDNLDVKITLLDESTNGMGITYPVASENPLESQTFKENMLILDEFVRIWNEYPRESFNSTMYELARTIHEECSSEDYSAYLPDDYREKYFINDGTEEDPDWRENEELWEERWDVEYDAIHEWIRDMSNEELLMWMERLVEFIGY